MKTLTIGSTTLELNSFSKRWDRIGGVFAQIEIPTTAISYEDLKALFTDNQYDLIVADDETTETFSGYAELNEIKENLTDGVYVVTQYCTATAMHLLNEARKEINAQATALDNYAKVVASQVETIATLEAQNKELNETVNALLGLEG